jgi:nicotinamide-nucleotide amidase
MLAGKGKTVSAAESCTGGLISSLFTSIPGSSQYYLGSVTSYANSVKAGVLGVPEEIISKYGAVSEECVMAMAEGVRKLTGSDFSVATSGIAGPGGGSETKPVGLVWIAVSSEVGTEAFRFVFRGDRKRNIDRFAANALNLLRVKVKKELNY